LCTKTSHDRTRHKFICFLIPMSHIDPCFRTSPRKRLHTTRGVYPCTPFNKQPVVASPFSRLPKTTRAPEVWSLRLICRMLRVIWRVLSRYFVEWLWHVVLIQCQNILIPSPFVFAVHKVIGWPSRKCNSNSSRLPRQFTEHS
jgi:hypothetical protein